MREIRILSLVATIVIVTNLPFIANSALLVGAYAENPAEPARIQIPAIGVDAQIQKVAITKGGAMGIPTNYTDVGWYKYGVLPGMLGSAVIDGHFDGKYVERAVFYDLSKLKKDDLVQVTDQNGQVMKFKVVETKIYDYASSTAEIFNPDFSRARLNLITCSGDWLKESKLYNKRVVVFTEFVE